MTNFAILLNIFKISSKFFLEYGFDHTLISRWRTGYRRLMPGRYQVEILVDIFIQLDNNMESSILNRILSTWYKTEVVNDEIKKRYLLERFLTEKGQTTDEYGVIRNSRLSFLNITNASIPDELTGIESVHIGMFTFLDELIGLSEPEQIYLVLTEGLFVYFDNKEFSDAFMSKLFILFDMGYRVTVIARCDRAISDYWNYSKILTRFNAHLKGYFSTRLYESYKLPEKNKVLGISGDKLAFRVEREDTWDFDNSRFVFENDSSSIEITREIIEEYISISRPVSVYNIFISLPSTMYSLSVPKSSSTYLFTRVPHFGIIPGNDFVQNLNISDSDQEILKNCYAPLLIDSTYFDKDTPIRHIFCETDISESLTKKRHILNEVSTILHRKVWMSTTQLVLQLKQIQSLLRVYKNYEVCFLSDYQISGLLPQIYLWENSAFICWLDSNQSAFCTHIPTVSGMKGFYDDFWNSIPQQQRNRSTSNKRLNMWLTQAHNAGYDC